MIILELPVRFISGTIKQLLWAGGACMPRNITPHSVLSLLKQQTTKALTALQREIARREQELAILKAEAARWTQALGGMSRKKVGTALTSLRGVSGKRSRLDWNAVLVELSPTFTAKEVAQKTGKPMEQVYAGVSRWMKDKKIKKAKDGYQKLGGGAAAQARE
jgi:hypothetical protein